jgi:hypothetical protein
MRSFNKGLLIALAFSLIPAVAISAQKVNPGSKCKVFKQKVIYQDKAYTSTTIDAGVAQQFGGVQPYYDGLVFRMKLPAGTKGIFPAGYHEPANGWTPSTTEAEFLLPRDSKFTIVAQRGKVWDVEYKP